MFRLSRIHNSIHILVLKKVVSGGWKYFFHWDVVWAACHMSSLEQRSTSAASPWRFSGICRIADEIRFCLLKQTDQWLGLFNTDCPFLSRQDERALKGCSQAFLTKQCAFSQKPVYRCRRQLPLKLCWMTTSHNFKQDSPCFQNLLKRQVLKTDQRI